MEVIYAATTGLQIATAIKVFFIIAVITGWYIRHTNKNDKNIENNNTKYKTEYKTDALTDDVKESLDDVKKSFRKPF